MSTCFAWGSRNWLRATRESIYGQYDPLGQVAWFRLVGDTAFSMQATPEFFEIETADALGELMEFESELIRVGGTLNTILYGPQTQFILDAALNLDSHYGCDLTLPSYTLDHYDGVRVIRYRGCRVSAFSLSASADNPPLMVNIGWIGRDYVLMQKTDLPEPDGTDFPTPGTHFRFQDSKGTLKLDQNVLQECYTSMELRVENRIDDAACEDMYIAEAFYGGRRIESSFDLFYKLANDVQLPFLNRTGLAHHVFSFSRGGYVLTFDLTTRAKISSLDRQFPLSGRSTVSITVQGVFDPVQGRTLGYTLTTP